MEAANNGSQENANGKNGDKYCNNVRFGSDIVVGDRQEEEDDGEEILKRRISSHPLYGQLIETHLNCLKVYTFMYIYLFVFLFLCIQLDVYVCTCVCVCMLLHWLLILCKFVQIE